VTESAATQSPRRWATIIGVVFALGWPFVLAIFIPNGNLHDLRQDGIILAAEWIWVIVVYAIVTGLERRLFFSTVGWRTPKRSDLTIVVFFALVAAALCFIIAKHQVSPSVRGTILAQVYGVPLAMRAALVFTAGICEETIYRGYALERLKLLTGNIWLGGFVATALFALAHLPRYGFTTGLLGVFFIGAVLSLIYIWRRNLWPCVALHWLVDGFALLIVPAFVTFK
jgi:uncharacterized protein